MVERARARKGGWRRPLLLLVALVAVAWSAVAAPAANPPVEVGSCTMAIPPTRTTVEAQIANAADFCELVSHALAAVFRTPVIVTPGRLWHYPNATLSCRLRYGDTRYQMTIRNSAAACRWLIRLAPNWHFTYRLQSAAAPELRG